MIKVSVIIPVYNGEKYLRQCLDSVRDQTLKDIEIICVDDGSDDASWDILEEYQRADARFHIYRQEHQYAGAARNTGLEAAAGEYVIFWDCDDYFALDALEKMYRAAATYQADMCVCDAQDFDSESGKYVRHSYLNKPVSELEVFELSEYQKYAFTFTAPVPWNKLILRKMMRQEQIRFQEIKHINDVLGIFTAISCAKRIAVCKEKLIYYRINRQGSLMDTYGEDTDSVFLAYEQLKTDLEQRGILENPELLRSFRNKALGVYLFMLKYCDDFSQFEAYYDSLKATRFPAVGLVDMEDGYIFSESNEEKYRQVLRLNAGEYVFWQYQKLILRNNILNQKEINQNEKLLQMREERELQKNKIQQQEKLLHLKSVKIAIKLSRCMGKLRHRK